MEMNHFYLHFYISSKPNVLSQKEKVYRAPKYKSSFANYISYISRLSILIWKRELGHILFFIIFSFPWNSSCKEYHLFYIRVIKICDVQNLCYLIDLRVTYAIINKHVIACNLIHDGWSLIGYRLYGQKKSRLVLVKKFVQKKRIFFPFSTKAKLPHSVSTYAFTVWCCVLKVITLF